HPQHVDLAGLPRGCPPAANDHVAGQLTPGDQSGRVVPSRLLEHPAQVAFPLGSAPGQDLRSLTRGDLLQVGVEDGEPEGEVRVGNLVEGTPATWGAERQAAAYEPDADQ